MRKLVMNYLLLFAVMLTAAVNVSAQTTNTRQLVAPQFAVGWVGTPGKVGSNQYMSDFQAMANSFAAGKPVPISFQKSDGSPMVVDILWSNGTRETNVSKSQLLSPKAKTSGGGTLMTCTSCGSSAQQSGVILFQSPFTWDTAGYDYNDDIGIAVTYRLLDWQGNELSSAGVDIKPPISQFSVPTIITSKIDTGFAVFNPNSTTVGLILNLFDTYRASGDPATPLASVLIALKANQQVALFFSSTFPGLKPDAKGNLVTDGHVEVTADQAVSVTALKCFFPANGGFVFAGIPILPLR
jgi:hypothetical protein